MAAAFGVVKRTELPPDWHKDPDKTSMRQAAANQRIPFHKIAYKVALAVPNSPIFKEYFDYIQEQEASSDIVAPVIMESRRYENMFGEGSIERAHIVLFSTGRPPLDSAVSVYFQRN
jgi:hypothetical protein